MSYRPFPNERPDMVTDLTVPVESHPNEAGGKFVCDGMTFTTGMHCPSCVAPADCVHVPLGHAVQLLCPGAAEYVPAGHGVQLVLPGSAKLPAGQMLLLQVDKFVAPATVENVPPGHSVQLPAPGCTGHLVVTASG